MVDLVAAPRTWKGILFLLGVIFAILFWFAATALIVWIVVVAAFGFVLFLIWLLIRAIVNRGERRFGGGY